MPENTAIVFDQADKLGLEALLIARVRMYTLFHKVFGGNTTAQLVEALVGPDTRDALEEFAGCSAEIQQLIRFLDTLAARDAVELADEAKYEYTRLFVGPGALPAPVTESPYRTNDPATVQENTLVVRTIYRMAGLQAKRLQRVPEDNVSMMCAFMADRAEASLEALRSADMDELENLLRDQQAFVVNHMGNWLPRFAELVRNRSKTAVMIPQLVEALSVFVQVDATLVAEAAYWAASVDLPEGGMPELPEEVAASFAKAEQSIESLKAMRLVGLEDVELVCAE